MTLSESPRQVRSALRAAMTDAMKRRDREATAVLRGALGAIDNAEAVPLGSEHRAGAVEAAVVGVGGSDVSRRELSEQDVVEVVIAEVDERRTAADLVERSHPEQARRLRREADLLSVVVLTPPAD